MTLSDEARAAQYARQKAWRDANPEEMREKRKASYARHRDKDRAYQRAYYAANAERLRAKARARAAAKKEMLREYARAWVRSDRVRNRGHYLLASARIRAARRGLDFDLTLDDIVIPPICPVLGIPIVVEAGKTVQPGAPSIDRMDNSRGYTRDNIRVISHRANSLKRDMTLEEARLIVANWGAR